MLPPPQKKKVKMTGWKIHDEDAFHCISYWNWWFSYWNWWFSDFDVLFVFSSSQGCTVANSKAVSVHPDTEPGGGGLLAVWSMWVMWWSEGFHLEPSSARKKSMLQHVWTFFWYRSFTNFTAPICQDFMWKHLLCGGGVALGFIVGFIREDLIDGHFWKKWVRFPKDLTPACWCGQFQTQGVAFHHSTRQAQRCWTKVRTWGRFYEEMRPLGRLIHL